MLKCRLHLNFKRMEICRPSSSNLYGKMISSVFGKKTIIRLKGEQFLGETHIPCIPECHMFMPLFLVLVAYPKQKLYDQLVAGKMSGNII